MRNVLLAAALALYLTGVSWAQAPALDVASYCSAEIAFGQSFGGSRVEREGRSLNHLGNRRAFAPRSSFQPFSEFEAGFTPTSRQLHSVQGTIVLVSREDARTTFQQIVEGLARDSRFQEHEIAEPDISPSGAVWRTAKFYAGNSQSESEQPTGFRIVLYFMERVSSESTIMMECVDAEIYRTAEREALADW
jgi:hypothetical protein